MLQFLYKRFMQVIKLPPPPAWPASGLARLKPERTRSSWTTMVWKKPGPPLPGLHLKPGRCSVSSFVQTCNSFYTNVSSVSSFVQPATVFIQTFLRSVLLFNLQQFLYKRFIQVIKLLPGLPPPAWLASCLARLLPGSPPAWLASEPGPPPPACHRLV